MIFSFCHRIFVDEKRPTDCIFEIQSESLFSIGEDPYAYLCVY